MTNNYDKNEFYRAHLARDSRFDGKFFVAVKSTGIYCRPTCPAKKAKLENLTFFIHAAQAEEAGFRPCLRCRPETAPGSPAWLGTSTTVQRAIRMMESFALEGASIKSIAENLGVGERWLRELFKEQVGASPQQILIAKKLDIARNLLDHSSLPMTEIALSSGFQSVRRFNDAFKKRFKKNPSAFKQAPQAESSRHLQLSYRPPYAWEPLLNFFEQRTLPAMEVVSQGAYQRLIQLGEMRGWIKIKPLKTENKLNVEFKFETHGNLLTLSARIKDMFDLDADPMTIESSLAEDKKLKPLLAEHSGLRIPGCWDGFELAVRAIVGQRISVKAARAVLIKLVALCGETQTFDPELALTHFFPTPEAILHADLSRVGLTATKIATLKTLAKALLNDEIKLDGTADYKTTCESLLAIKGIGPWTVEYIAMRTLKNPDAFPETDLEVQKKLKQFKLDPTLWAPWRAYATVLLLSCNNP